MRAAQVMTPDVLSLLADATVFEAAELLVGTGVSAMPVVDTEPRRSWLERVFSDEVSAAKEYVALHARRVRDVMSKPVVSVQEDDTLGRVADIMARHKVKRVPVLRGELVVGIVSRANLLQALLSRDPQAASSHPADDQIRREVEAVVGKQPWTSPWPINILVNAGVVHLWGFVSSEAASDAYRVSAENVAGVKKVKNHLRRMPASVGMGV